MLSEFINKIIDLKRPEKIDHENRTYMLYGYSPVKEPIPDTIKIHTLTGIIDYIRGDIDKISDQKLFIHISNHNEVWLSTELFGEWKQREDKIQSVSFDYQKINGRWMDHEDFIIALNSLFVQTDDSHYLLRIISGISDAAQQQIADNGISQTIAVKSGISLLDNVEVKNPVTLKPFRTFPEIDQPDIQFVFRIKKNNGIQCALFEADGGKWQIETIQKIKAWFQDQMSMEIEAVHNQFENISIIA